MLSWLQSFWAQHGVVGILAAWPLITAALNTLFRLKSPQDWVTWADSNPKTKVLVDIVRGWGVDPFAAAEALKVYQDKVASNKLAEQNGKETEK